MTEFRNIQEDDLPAILAIEQKSFADPWSETLFRSELADDGHKLNAVMLENGRLTGYGLGWVVFEEFHLGNIAIEPEHRGQGRGRNLLLHILALAAGRGCTMVSLEVRPSNQAAISLYQKHGFREIAIRKHYYGREDALVMMASLPVIGNAGSQ